MRTLFLSCCAVLPSFLFAQTHLDFISNYNVRPAGAYSALWGYTAPDGREYAVLGVQGGGSSPGGTSIIDITDAENPTESAFITGPNSLWREMKTYSHYAYVVTESGGGVQIIDLSQLPDTAWLVRSFNYTQSGKNISSSHTISIHGGYMYLNGCSGWSPGGVVIFDLRADPENPEFVGTYEPAYIHDCYVLRDTIYGAAIYGQGLFIADATNKTNILPIGLISYAGAGTHNSWVTKDRRYVITTDEIGTTPKTLKMWDISDLPTIPTTPAATYTSNPGRIEHNVTIRGNYAYVAWYDDGVQVVNVTDPANPTNAGGYNQTGNLVWGVYPFFPSGKIIGGDMVTGLWTFSFSDLAPRVPVMLLEPADNDSVSLGNPVTFRWTRAADLDADPHYYEVHITGPSLDTTWHANDSTTMFTDVGRLVPGNSYFWNVLTRDEWNTTFSPDTFRFSYGAATPPGIPCSDITNMAARCIGGGVKTIQVRVNLLNNTIHAGKEITIAIDENQYTSTIITNGTHSRANFSVPGWSIGDHVVSLVDPPGCLADKHANCVAGDGIAKADPYWDDDAEWMATVQEVPQATELLGNYPNPFNPSCNIQYALSEDAHVTLGVYNMLGQVVATLVDEPQTAGYKSVAWSGRNDSGVGVASGIYIYRMTAGSFTATKRMLLLK